MKKLLLLLFIFLFSSSIINAQEDIITLLRKLSPELQLYTVKHMAEKTIDRLVSGKESTKVLVPASRKGSVLVQLIPTEQIRPIAKDEKLLTKILKELIILKNSDPLFNQLLDDFEIINAVGEKLKQNFSPEKLSNTLSELSEKSISFITKVLIAAGADPNVKDIYDGTPLYYAVANNQLELVKFLIEKGADTQAKMFDQTALELARNKGNQKIIGLLEKAAQEQLARN